MNEFLAVAKSLEIKELCNAEPESTKDQDDETTPSNPVTSAEERGEEIVPSDHLANQVLQKRIKEVVSVNGDFECEPCQKTFISKRSFYQHKQSVHEGVKYACDQCDYQASRQDHLTTHIQSKHEGIKYACDQCEYQATTQGNLTVHIKSKHEGVKYSCDQCDYQAGYQSLLNRHMQSKH